MVCPKCGSSQLIVVDSRDSTKNKIRRRRECSECKYRFTTYEASEMELAKVEAELARLGKTLNNMIALRPKLDKAIRILQEITEELG